MVEREMFEAWAKERGLSLTRAARGDGFASEEYAFAARHAWAAWQAARRAMPDREATIRAGEDVVITNVPNRIYLNLGDIYEMGELPFQQLTDVTWCEDRIDDTDIEYVRAAAPTSDKGGA